MKCINFVADVLVYKCCSAAKEPFHIACKISLVVQVWDRHFSNFELYTFAILDYMLYLID